jgi:hypothetical protein
MKSGRGQKLIQVLRLLTEGIMTKKEIAKRTNFSLSETRELLKKGLEEELVEACTGEGKVHKKPGRPLTLEQEDVTGRPSNYYFLSGDGKWLIRSDPEVRDRWNQTEATYEKLVEHTGFDSYADLVDAIRRHPKLTNYQKSNYFINGELERVVLNPFLYIGEYRAKEVIQLYDELVRVIKTSVRSEDVVVYYQVLEGSLKELNVIVDCHKALMKKMQTLPEVQEYLRKNV